MGEQRTKYETFFTRRRAPREPQWESVLLAVADAYDATQESGVLTDAQLRVVVDGASSHRALVWQNAVSLLKALTERWDEAAQAVLEMSRSRNAHVRFNAICSLGTGTPTAIVDAVLRAGLVDKSARVRWKAADKANDLYKKDLIPAMTEALARESNEKTCRTIQFELLLLRDGYILKPESDGWFKVTARTKQGCAGRGITAAELDQKGIEAIVAELQQ